MGYFIAIVVTLVFGFLSLSCSPSMPRTPEAVEVSAQDSQEIVGGDPVSVDDPIAKSTVALYLQTKHSDQVTMFCSGTLISPRHVLTAAHCVVDVADQFKTTVTQLLNHIKVGLGNTVIDMATDSRVRLISIKNAIFPSNYQVEKTSFDIPDIAVLTLEETLPNGFHPVELADGSFLRKGQPIVVAGFGLRFGIIERPSWGLRKVRLSIANPRFSTTHFTHRVRLTKGPCLGDSGGPVYVTKENGQLAVLGVTSWSVKGCTLKGAYTSVPVFANWILNVMK
jgi:secreted trypsin-like serine protease